MSHSGDRVTLEAVRAQLGGIYDQFDAAVQARHVELLRAIKRPKDTALEIQAVGDTGWVVTVCIPDYIGVLSLIAGLFTAYCLNILSVDAFTLDFPAARERSRPRRRREMRSRRGRPAGQPRPSKVILDVFHVRLGDRADPDFWRTFRDDLAGLVALLADGEGDAARDQVIDRVSEATGGLDVAEQQLFPVSIELTNDASPICTKLTIRTADTLGFLFSFANALAILNVRIERAEIRTIHGEVDDEFWLTDSRGHKIVAEERIQELRVAAALIKHFTYLLPRSPNPAQALRQFNALTHQILSRPDWTRELRDLESMEVLEVLAELMGVSRFLWDDFLRMQHQNLFPVLLDTPALEEHIPKQRLREVCRRRLCVLTGHPARVRGLNGFKDREMFRIDLRHITRRTGFREFSEELSELADVVVAEAAELSHLALRQQFGVPMLENAGRCQWCICALGKFGGMELGFGSDVELIFVYEGEGTTDGPTAIDNSRYFGDFVLTFQNALKSRREGIFEIDLRLRPHGSAGALASSLGGFEAYYSDRGAARQFERMALVKLRPVAGDLELGAQVVRSRDCFVYSGRPLDIENVLHLRRRQVSELVPTGAVSAKHSPGGLVDLEYFVQACQIAVGRLDSGVRVTNTLESIDRLVQGGHMLRERAGLLREAYGFMRRLIDALRVVRGHAKDLTIPDRDSREFAYLTQRLQFDSTTRLHDAIAEQMGLAAGVWEDGVPANT